MQLGSGSLSPYLLLASRSLPPSRSSGLSTVDEAKGESLWQRPSWLLLAWEIALGPQLCPPGKMGVWERVKPFLLPTLV